MSRLISWNRLLLVAVSCLLGLPFSSMSQTVYYYKHTKAKINGVISPDVSGGQFICFYQSVCFDSDANGVGVGNGQLSLQRNDGDNIVYSGESYFGKESFYIFDKQRYRLNIIAPNGNVYAFVRSNAPTGQKTSSLVRAKTSSSAVSSSGGNVINSQSRIGVIVEGNYDGYPVESTGGSSHSGVNTRTPKTCGLCGGKGWIVSTKGVPDFGTGNVWCKECNQSVPPNHYHETCPSCNGKGAW